MKLCDSKFNVLIVRFGNHVCYCLCWEYATRSSSIKRRRGSPRLLSLLFKWNIKIREYMTRVNLWTVVMSMKSPSPQCGVLSSSCALGHGNPMTWSFLQDTLSQSETPRVGAHAGLEIASSLFLCSLKMVHVECCRSMERCSCASLRTASSLLSKDRATEHESLCSVRG